jgi:hypothetical protein
MLTAASAPSVDQVEMVRLLGDSWVLTDTSHPHEDPRCLIGYVEETADGFEVVWVQAPMGSAHLATKDAVFAAAAARIRVAS